jgi:8-oxo-dGTP pyrophosphatase MutT (NUDIX family)
MPIAPHALRQAAVIPIRAGRVCLVLSSSGKRWVVPKGRIERGQAAGETALQEAWEEAGLVGTLHHEPVGSYLYKKAGTICHVTVFVMHVIEAAQDWPERARRMRRWLRPARAQTRIEDASLRKLLTQVLAADPVAVALQGVESSGEGPFSGWRN